MGMVLKCLPEKGSKNRKGLGRKKLLKKVLCKRRWKLDMEPLSSLRRRLNRRPRIGSTRGLIVVLIVVLSAVPSARLTAALYVALIAALYVALIAALIVALIVALDGSLIAALYAALIAEQTAVLTAALTVALTAILDVRLIAGVMVELKRGLVTGKEPRRILRRRLRWLGRGLRTLRTLRKR